MDFLLTTLLATNVIFTIILLSISAISDCTLPR